ncbi:MAG: MerC family mercury resistance protein [Alphaproteobacteria bacterium]|nr:MerC family mercury resistance protein [Alphaproteobacteria bacterium]
MRDQSDIGAANQDGAGQDSAGALPFGFLAYLGAGLSVLFCYAGVLAELITPLLGLAPIGINPHLQAVLMWGSALLAVIALWRDAKRHRNRAPLALGCAGFAVIAGTLYTYYDILILILGYLLLVAAVLLNPLRLLADLNRSVRLQAARLADLNATLEARVDAQVEEIERLARLKRFLSSEVADLITVEDKESLLESHRRLIACLFCDIRNFTAFSDAVEPEEVMDVLQGVHSRMGELVAAHGGTIGYRAGDGLMVIFNDPLPCEDPVLKAAKLALEMKAAFSEVQAYWHRRGHDIGIGIGISYGYATLGLIGSEGRFDYTAIGNAVNLAARLCDCAKDGEILLDPRAAAEIEGVVQMEAVGRLELKGVAKPVEAFRVVRLDGAA